MKDKIPNVKDSDIKRIIERDFAEVEFTEIEDLLKKYNSQSNKGKNRIYASVLKLSDGNIDLVKKYVEMAVYDYRDVISLAEYPNFQDLDFDHDLPKDVEKRYIIEDWAQYQAWLNKI